MTIKSNALRLNLITLLFGTVGMVAVLSHFWKAPWSALRLIGLIICIASFVLIFIARLQLGRAFSVSAKAELLVTTGLYARIRNPIYLFGTLALCGFALWTQMPWLLLGLIILIPMQIVRARKEEQVLAERFGAAYAEYKRKTWL